MRNACCAHRKAPVRFTSTTRCQSLRLSSSNGTASVTVPALLNNRSRRPWSARTWSNSAATESGSLTSTTIADPDPPSGSQASAVAASRWARRPAATTCHPSPANARAADAPMPLPAPVTTATLRSRGARAGTAGPLAWGTDCTAKRAYCATPAGVVARSRSRQAAPWCSRHPKSATAPLSSLTAPRSDSRHVASAMGSHRPVGRGASWSRRLGS